MTDDRSTPRRSLAEIRAELRKFQREQRDARLRRGTARPRTLREMEIFGEYIAERGRVPDDDKAPGDGGEG